jgi:hypothetical protein
MALLLNVESQIVDYQNVERHNVFYKDKMARRYFIVRHFVGISIFYNVSFDIPKFYSFWFDKKTNTKKDVLTVRFHAHVHMYIHTYLCSRASLVKSVLKLFITNPTTFDVTTATPAL